MATISEYKENPDYTKLVGLDLETLRVRCVEQEKEIRRHGNGGFDRLRERAENLDRANERLKRENESLERRVKQLEQYALTLEAQLEEKPNPEGTEGAK